MTVVAWAFASLRRHLPRTLLSLAGIAVSAAMLLDMVMLSGGIETSFAQMLLARGYQMRLSPKGTLPMDTEATMDSLGQLLRVVRADPAVERAGPVLGVALQARVPRRSGDTLITLFGYGIDPAAQGIYDAGSGPDLAAGDTTGLLLSAPAAAALGLKVGDTVAIAGPLDPQLADASRERRMVVRGTAEFLYDYRGQRSVAAALPAMQALSSPPARDRASVLMVRLRPGAPDSIVAERLGQALPNVQVSSLADLVQQFRQRLTYFRQLSLILGSVALVVTVLLVGTLLTITVNERLGEIATLRAIGIARETVLRTILLEGAVLTAVGGAAGVLLGLVTARWLDRILTSFPGLPASVSFFVADGGAVTRAALVLALSGTLAGLWPAWLAARAPIAATLRAEAT